MKKSDSMYSFSTQLWYDPRWVSKSGVASIYIQVSLDGTHKEFPLKLRWPVACIDRLKGILLPRKEDDQDVADYNLMIRIEDSKITEILRTYRLKEALIDVNLLKWELKHFSKKKSFVAFMRRDSLARYNEKDIDYRTWLNTQSAIELMIIYNEEWLFERLTSDWMNGFKRFLQRKDYEPGYIWTTIKNVKAYLERASKEPMISVADEAVEFPNPEPSWKTQFCNRDEVNKLIKLYKARTLLDEHQEILKAFLFTCFTSLRISDVYRVNDKWRLTEGFLDFIPKKNEKKKKWVHIPIMPMAYAFVRNSVGRYFELPTEQNYNAALKFIATSAGINKQLTSHYGRHTFGHLYMVTVGNLKGLQEILGHSKIETTMRYAHLDDDYKTESVLKMQDEFPELLTLRVKRTSLN